MKKSIYELVNNIINGDSFNEWFTSWDDAVTAAEKMLSNFSKSERSKNDVTVYRYEITCDGCIDDANQFYADCYNGDIDCPEFDAVTGGYIGGKVIFTKDEAMSQDKIETSTHMYNSSFDIFFGNCIGSTHWSVNYSDYTDIRDIYDSYEEAMEDITNDIVIEIQSIIKEHLDVDVTADWVKGKIMVEMNPIDELVSFQFDEAGNE